MRCEVRAFHRALLDIASILELVSYSQVVPPEKRTPMVLEIPDRITFFALQELLIHDIQPWLVSDQKMVQDLQIQENEFMFAGWKIRWRKP